MPRSLLALSPRLVCMMDDMADTARAALSSKTDRFLADENTPTPFVVVDLDRVRAQHQRLADAMPFAEIFYAVKANPAPQVLAALAERGVSFDLASDGEMERCFSLGIAATRFSFGNTIKRETDIVRAYTQGVRLFAFDSEGELDKLARAAPGAAVFCRLAVPARGADWPLTRKFGCHAEWATDLLLRARRQGLKPVGVSFHVGSQQTEPEAWHAAIGTAHGVFRNCARNGLPLDLLNLGGGLPAQYRAAVPPLARYAETIESSLRERFGQSRPRIIIEPGRYMAGDAGVLRSQVLLIARKSRQSWVRWVYLDAGRYNGLPETLDERIRYRLRTEKDGGPLGPVILAGPTCDSTDVLYERAGYELPLDLAIGDTVDFLSAGAYTASYASVEFNGFAPIRAYCVE